jgi:hypothetical protein
MAARHGWSFERLAWLGVAMAGSIGAMYGVVAGGGEGLMVGAVTGSAVGVGMAAVEWRIRRDQQER